MHKKELNKLNRLKKKSTDILPLNVKEKSRTFIQNINTLKLNYINTYFFKSRFVYPENYTLWVAGALG